VIYFHRTETGTTLLRIQDIKVPAEKLGTAYDKIPEDVSFIDLNFKAGFAYFSSDLKLSKMEGTRTELDPESKARLEAILEDENENGDAEKDLEQGKGPKRKTKEKTEKAQE
jgi:hypothetical protein